MWGGKIKILLNTACYKRQTLFGENVVLNNILDDFQVKIKEKNKIINFDVLKVPSIAQRADFTVLSSFIPHCTLGRCFAGQNEL